jgi:anti-sigma factor RsiW
VKALWVRRPGAHDITCQQAVSLVTAYLDSALRPRNRARFEAHVAECPHCDEHLKQIEVSIRVTGAVRVEDLAPAARQDLVDVYRRWRDDTDGS